MHFYKSLACMLSLGALCAPRLLAAEVRDLTPTEAFVLREFERGRSVNLEGRAPEDRVLSADFLAKLVTGSYSIREIDRSGVTIAHAVFKDRVIVSGTDVPFRVWLTHCLFKQGIDFGGTRFARDLSFEGSQFGDSPSQIQHAPEKNDDADAFFVGMKANGAVDFSGAKFYMSADFTRMELGGEFVFDRVDYQSVEVADFENIKISGPAFFRDDIFAAPLRLNDAELFELFIENNVPETQDSTRRHLTLYLNQARIARNISIKNIALNSWSGRFLMTGGEVRLDDVSPLGPVDLSHSHFGNLAILGFEKWLALKPRTLNLEGFSFDGVDVDNNIHGDLPATRMLELINSESCPFSPQLYAELEKFFRAHGNSGKADETYIDMRRRQRQTLSWMHRPWDWLLYEMLGYGKETWRAAVLAVLIAILGIFVFRAKRMEWRNPEKQQEPYNRFWYSLDQLAPVIDLEAAKNWKPKDDNHWVRNYAIVHRIMGWILLPLIVGAITGIIK